MTVVFRPGYFPKLAQANKINHRRQSHPMTVIVSANSPAKLSGGPNGKNFFRRKRKVPWGHTKTFHSSSLRNQSAIQPHSVGIITVDLYSQWAKSACTSMSQGPQGVQALFLLGADCTLRFHLCHSDPHFLPGKLGFLFHGRGSSWWGTLESREEGTGKKKKLVSQWRIYLSQFNCKVSSGWEGSGDSFIKLNCFFLR